MRVIRPGERGSARRRSLPNPPLQSDERVGRFAPSPVHRWTAVSLAGLDEVSWLGIGAWPKAGRCCGGRLLRGLRWSFQPVKITERSGLTIAWTLFYETLETSAPTFCSRGERLLATVREAKKAW